MAATTLIRLIGFSLVREVNQTNIDIPKLVTLAERAYLFQRVDVIEFAARALLALPSHQWLGQYYQALAAHQREQFIEAKSLFEAVAESAPDSYRARALVSLGGLAFRDRDARSALEFYRDAGILGFRHDMRSAVQARKMQAVTLSMNGDHAGALNLLKQIAPLVRTLASAYSMILADYQNSVAVELGEVGRVDEARAFARLALASPFPIIQSLSRETLSSLPESRKPTQSRAPSPKPAPTSNVVEMADWPNRHTATRLRLLQLIVKGHSLDGKRIEAARRMIEEASPEQVDDFLKLAESNDTVSNIVAKILKSPIPYDVIDLLSKIAEMRPDHSMMRRRLMRYFGVRPNLEPKPEAQEHQPEGLQEKREIRR
jgi:tetratricopeptide (TPR) repeat protein